MKKVFVTGGAGFIGSHVVQQLLSQGKEAVVYDNLSTGYESLIPEGAEFVHGDLSDFDLLKSSIEGCDAVVHLVATSIVPESIKYPVRTFENNVVNGVTVLEAMRIKNVPKMIFSSSASVYGNSDQLALKEDHPRKPVSPYGASKSAFEDYLHAYYNCYGIQSISLRYFNAYGPGELHDPETHAIPNFIKSILAKKSITVYGTGEQIRDFVFVEDIVQAHLAALNSSAECDCYNIGAGQGISINALISKLASIFGYKLEVQHGKAREGDPFRLVADISKIRKDLGWEPTTDFDHGLRKTIDWFKKLG